MNAARRALIAATLAWSVPLSLAPLWGAEPQPPVRVEAQSAAGVESPPAASSALTLDAILVDPAASAADTLHQLRVRIRNDGEQPASHLAFRVRVGTHDLVVYRNLVYLQALAPKASTEVRLHHFWSSESGRPFPADGKLTVEVTLAEAKWVRIEIKDGIESTTPVASVAGLPIQRSVTLGGNKK